MPILKPQQLDRLTQPEKKTIRQIIESTGGGDLAIPNFQRYFRWDVKDIQDLFESIFRGYYTGAFLFWEADNRSELDIIPIFGTPLKKRI